MAWTKTIAASALNLPSSVASAIGNITITIDRVSSATVTEANANYIVAPVVTSVTRSSGANLSDNVQLSIDIVASSESKSWGSDAFAMYIADAKFLRGTSKQASLVEGLANQETMLGVFYAVRSSSYRTNTKVYLTVKVSATTGNTFLDPVATYTYGMSPVISSATLNGDAATLPSGWNGNYLYNKISIPELLVVCDFDDQPQYCEPDYVFASFDAADASGRMTSYWAFNTNEDYVTPHFYFPPNLNSGTVQITAYSERETSAQTTINLPFRKYSEPEVSSLTAFRSDSSGNPLDEGTDVHVEGNVTVYMSNDTQDAVDVTIELYDGSTKVAEKSLTLDGSGVVGSWDRYTLGLAATLTPSDSTASTPPEELADLTKKYTVTVTVEDDAKSGSSSEIVPMAFYTFHSLPGGHGVGIGKPATVAGLLDVGMDMNVDGDIKQNGTRVMPMFAVTSWSTSSDESTLPATPCIVLSLSDMGLYHCTG